MRNSRILIISSYTIPDYAGGGINAWHLARYLKSIEIPCLLLTFNRNLKFKSKETHEGVTIRRIPYFNFNYVIKFLSFVFLIFPCLFLQIYRSEFVYVVGGNIIGYRSILLLGRILGCKTMFRSSMWGYDDVHSLLERSKGLKCLTGTILNQIHTYISINLSKSYSSSSH